MSHSLLFRDIILKNMKKKSLTIAIPKIRASIFHLIYTWMYTCSLEFNYTDLKELLAAAKQLKMPVLIEECHKLSSKDSEVKNLLIDHKQAIELGIGNEIGKSTRRIAQNFRDTVSSSHFVDFTEKGVRWLITMDDIYINSEVEVFEAVFQWIKHRWLERSIYAVDLFSHVRFGLMNDKELIDCLLNRRYSAIMSIPQIREMILRAMLSHVVLENNLSDYSELLPPPRVCLYNMPEKKVSSKELCYTCIPLYGSNMESTQIPSNKYFPIHCKTKFKPYLSPRSLSNSSLSTHPTPVLPSSPTKLSPLTSITKAAAPNSGIISTEAKKKDSNKKMSAIKFTQMIDFGNRLSESSQKIKCPKISLPTASSSDTSSSVAAEEEINLIQKYTTKQLSLLEENSCTTVQPVNKVGELTQFALTKSEYKKARRIVNDEDVGKLGMQDVIGRLNINKVEKNLKKNGDTKNCLFY